MSRILHARCAGLAAGWLAVAASLSCAVPATCAAAGPEDAARAESDSELAQGRVTLAPHWRVGDHVVYRVVQTSASTQDGDSKPLVPPTDNTITVDVRAVDAGGYLVDWRAGAPPGSSLPMPSDPAEAKLAQRVLSTPMTLRIDARGQVVEVVNWQQLRDLANDGTAMLTAFLRKRGVPDEMLALQEQSAQASVADEPALRASRTRQVGVLFALLGRAYDRAAPGERHG